MSAVFDVRCDRCGERGSATRMSLVGGICFYCREDPDLERIDEPDPDRAYDEKRDRMMLGIDVPDGAE